MDFPAAVDHRIKTEQISGRCEKTEEAVEHKGDVIKIPKNLEKSFG